MKEIKFYCPACRQRVVCDAEYGGLSSTCPTCQSQILIPSEGAVSPQPPLPVPASSSTQQRDDWKKMKIPMGLAALILTIWGGAFLPAMSQVLGNWILLFAFVFTFLGFVLSVVSLFKKDGWEFGLIAMLLCILLSVLF